MITKGHEKNFMTLVRAARNEDLCIIECIDDATGNPVITICAVNYLPDGTVECMPLAKMFDGNPFEQLRPPQLKGDIRDTTKLMQ